METPITGYMPTFTSKVAIITGASSGIGKALAVKFAKEKFQLVLTARNLARLFEVKNEIERMHNVRVLCISGEISSEEFCKRLIKETLEHFGRIDVLVNNAGISMRGLFQETQTAVLKKLMDVNFWGSVYCTQFALPSLLENKGSIIGISSIAGIKGLPGRSGYSASKFALQGFLESVRIENRKRGLHILIACPGYTASNIRNVALNSQGEPQGETPLNENKLMSAERVSEHIYNAYIHKKKYLVLTTEGKLLSLINKFSIRLSDWIVYKHFLLEHKSPLK